MKLEPAFLLGRGCMSSYAACGSSAARNSIRPSRSKILLTTSPLRFLPVGERMPRPGTKLQPESLWGVDTCGLLQVAVCFEVVTYSIDEKLIGFGKVGAEVFVAAVDERGESSESADVLPEESMQWWAVGLGEVAHHGHRASCAGERLQRQNGIGEGFDRTHLFAQARFGLGEKVGAGSCAQAAGEISGGEVLRECAAQALLEWTA